MNNAIKRLCPFDSKHKCLNVIIETPKGSRVKYAYDQDTGLFALKRALPEGMMFPFNFGFIPSTQGEDGDPLDILILNEEPLVPGCLIKVRLLAAIKAQQTEEGKTIRNDRLIGLAISKETPTFLERIKLDKKTVFEIEYFFKSYNKLDGKKFKVLGLAGRAKAEALVRKAQKKLKR
jgi:inorganic pyrophosphatase